MDMLFTESIAFYYSVDFSITAWRMSAQFHERKLPAKTLFLHGRFLSLPLTPFAVQLTIALAR
jgi:hypothetical protein